MAWMRQLLDWQREAADGKFLESLRYDAVPKRFSCLLGDVITLPTSFGGLRLRGAPQRWATRCISARVNGRLVALERKLENGEVVEVFTSKARRAVMGTGSVP